MTEKLSTKKLKELIGGWLSKPEVREDLKHHSDCGDRCASDGGSALDYTAHLFGFRKGCTQAELEQHIWGMWCDGSQWKREEKHKLGPEWDSYFAQTDWDNKPVDWKPGQPIGTIPSFPIDMIGECDEALVKKFHDDQAQAEKCIFRMFVPGNQLADNYRLEVVTTPDDTQVVGWTVIVD